MMLPRVALRDPGVGFLFQKETRQGGYEYPTRRFFDVHLQPGDLFIDVGAHWGIFTLQAATRHRHAIKVLAIEPHPQNIEQLKGAVRLNDVQDDVEIVATAAGAKAGAAPLLINSTMGHSLYGHGLPPAARDTTQITVPVVALDRLLAERPDLGERRTFLKVDVEGFEPEVLAGARDLLESGRVAAVVWEYGRAMLGGKRREKMLAMVEQFHSRGFTLFRFPHPGMGGPLVPFAPTPGCCNVFALAPGFDRLPYYDKPNRGPEPLPIPNKAPADPETRAATTELLLARKLTDAARWADFEALHKGADERAGLAAPLVAPGSSLLDLGAGTMALGEVIGTDCRYQPADLLPYADNTIVVDLNQGQFPEGAWDAVAALELFEYIHDVPALLRRCRASARRLVFTYRLRDRQDITARREKGWFNDFSHDDMRAMLQRTGWTAIIAEKVPGSGLPYLCAAE